MRQDFKKPDLILIIIVAILIIFGFFILSTTSTVLSQKNFANPYYYLKHQLFFGLLPGIFLAILAFKFSIDFLKKISPYLFLVNLILTAMVFLPPIGLKAGGAQRWLHFGGLVFQPSEFLKITFILYLASWLASRFDMKKLKYKEKKFSQTLVPFLIISIISLILILQPDVTTLGIIVLVGFLMYFIIETPLWHSILFVSMGIVGLLILIPLAPYRIQRWTIFLNPEIDPLGMGYQLKQSLIAIGSGGILGLGLGMSRQKFGFLPHSISDSIFAIFAEEAGFLGVLILIFLFLIILWRGFKIAKLAQERFSQLMAIGITSWIFLQFFINVGAMIGVLPLAGVPLPFVSYGGSHLICELIGLGILLNISKS